MFFFKQFETVDPISGDIPTQPFSYMAEIAFRARTLLSCKMGSCREEEDRKKISLIARRINDVIKAYFADALEAKIMELKKEWSPDDEEFEIFFEWHGGSKANGQWFFKTEMIEELGIPTEANTSEVDALKAVIENRDSNFFLPEGAPDPAPEEYPEGKDYELFAVLSLWLLADAMGFLNKTEVGTSVAGEFALKAMDAVCYAEHLHQAEWLLSYVEKKGDAKLKEALRIQKAESSAWIKYCLAEKANREALKKAEQSKQMNIARHQKTKDAKSIAVDEWVKDKSKYSSAEEAGHHIADLLEGQGILNSATRKPYQPRTVTVWIREHAKLIGVRFR